MGQGGDAVLHDADVLEQRGHLPHDPVRHAVDLQDHGHDRGDRAGADEPVPPEPQRVTARRQDQACHQCLVDDLELADQAHLAVARVLEILHRGAGEPRLALGVREEFDGGDVGVGVGHASRHRGAGVGLFLADLAQTRHEIRHGQPVQREPADEGQRQPGVETARHRDQGEEVHADAEHDLAEGQQHITHREGGLHDFGGDPAGEFVGEEGQALAQHQPVEVPAQPQRQADGQHLVLHGGAQRHQAYAGDHHDGDAPQYALCVFGGPGPGSPGFEQVHHLAQESEQPGFVDGDARAQCRQRGDVAPRAARAGPKVRKQAFGRQRRVLGRERIEQAFEPMQQRGLQKQAPTPRLRLAAPRGGR